MKADVIMQSPNIFAELESPNVGNSQEDQRALQIALELSNLGLLGNCDDDSSTSSYDEITKGKKSQNMTECVPVPSSEHVAEIVGRQGCKIKALRAKTNTYIKTPVRGEEPVFVVTGRKEDVAMARREVQSAAEHFTQIRASRNRHAVMNGQTGITDAEGSGAGTITLQVRVPYRVVGLVVGPKGATIKRIQQQTHTYIVTPSRDKEPVFEVTGLPENVEKAKEEIEAHIASRTGSQQTSIDDDFKNNGTEVGSPLSNNYVAKPPTALNALYKPAATAQSAFMPYNANQSALRSQAPSFFPASANPGFLSLAQQQQQINLLNNLDHSYQPNNIPGFPLNGALESIENTLAPGLQRMKPSQNKWSTGSLSDAVCSAADQMPQYTPRRSSSANGSNPGLSPTSSLASGGLQHSRLSPTLSDTDFSILPPAIPASGNMHLPVRRVGSDSMESTTSSIPSVDLGIGNLLPPSSNYSGPTPALNIESGYSSSGTTDSLASGSPVESTLGQVISPRNLDGSVFKPQRCVLCNEGSVIAALVPCGHNLFCYSCANGLVSQPAPTCPCCQQPAKMALLIKK